MGYNFDEIIERNGTGCTKWDGMEPGFGRTDLLPLWIADMDFAVPPSVAEAVQKRAAHGIYGYAAFPSDYHDGFVAWQQRRNNWDVKKEWICHTPGVVSAVSMALQGFTAPGDGVLLLPPVYHPFRITIEAMGRRVVNSPMIEKDGRFEVDVDDLAQKAVQARIFILCNPQNPTGRVFSREELERIEAICRQHNLLVISDEIHSDIIYGGRKHIPFATLSDWAQHHSFVLMAPSKTFNIAGLATSLIIVPDDMLRRQFLRVTGEGCHIGGGNVFGLVACQAAFEQGEAWLEELLVYLEGNVAFVEEELARRVPSVKLLHPEGIYVPLIDFRGLGKTPEELRCFLLDDAKVAMNDGTMFGPGGEGFARLNIATPRANLAEFINRLEKALNK